MILIAASEWGIIGIFTRALNEFGFDTIQITFIRSIITAVLMGVFLLTKDRSLLRIRLRDFRIFLGTGIVSIVFFNVCYFMAIQLTTLSAASVLLYTAPCFVMLMSALFFKEKITVQKLLALVIALPGCALASGFAGGDISALALLTGLGAGIGYAAYSIFGKVALKKYHTFTIIFYTFTVATVGLLPFANIPHMVQILGFNGGAVMYSLGLGTISTFMPYLLYTFGLENIEAGKASVLAFAEPMVAAITGIIVFGEYLNFKIALGIDMIFLAIVLLNIKFKRFGK